MADKEALKVFDEISNFCNLWSWNSQTFANAIERAKNALIVSIRNGSFEVMPIKHGQWIKNDDRSGWHCSCCGKDNLYAYPYTQNNERELQDFYCPNCGAKMDEVENG